MEYKNTKMAKNIAWKAKLDNGVILISKVGKKTPLKIIKTLENFENYKTR